MNRCPEDWTADEKLRNWAEVKTPRVVKCGLLWPELEKMKDYEFKRKYKDWDAVARNWLRKAEETLREKEPKPMRNTYVEPEKQDEWDRAANRAFVRALMLTWRRTGSGLPRDMIDRARPKIREMKQHFRVMDSEGEAPPIDDAIEKFTEVFRKAYREVQA